MSRSPIPFAAGPELAHKAAKRVFSVAFLSFFLVLVSSPSFAAFTVFTDRASWEAALLGVMNEDLNSFTGPNHDLRNGGVCNGPLGIGDYTFSSTIACVGGKASIAQAAGGVNGTANLAQFGTNTGGRTDIVVDINQSVGGIGFDYACANIRWRVDVPGNSGLHTEMIDCGGTGFLGIIDDQGGVTSYTLYSSPSPNFDSLVVDNLAFGLLAPGAIFGGLAAWFKADAGVTADGLGLVSRWDDLSGNHRDAVQADPSRQPELRAGGPGGNPTLRFERDAMPFDGTFLANSNYTVFAVEGRDRFGVANFFLGGDTAGVNQNLVLGYENESLLRQAHFGNDLDAVVPAYNGTQDFALTTFTFDMSEGRTIQRFGLPVASDNSTAPLSSYTGAALGAFPALFFFYEGDIAELIVYSRALSCEERNAVNLHLADKYGLPFTPENCGADLRVQLSDAPDPVAAGSQVRYRAEVNNGGPSDATGVQLISQLAAGTGFVSAATLSGGACSFGNGSIDCPLGAMASGAGESVDIVLSIREDTIGPIVLEVAVAGDQPDPDPGNNSDREETRIDTSTDVSLTAAVFGQPLFVEQPFRLRSTVVNAGPATANFVQYRVVLPPGLQLQSTFVSPFGACVQRSDLVTCNLGNLRVGESRQVDFDLSTSFPGALRLAGDLTLANRDTNPQDNFVRVAIDVQPQADLGLIKLGPPLAAAGRSLEYQLEVNNQGPSDANEVIIIESLPLGATLDSITGVCLEAEGGNGGNAGALELHCGNMAAGQTEIVVLNVSLGPDLRGEIVNRASVSSGVFDRDESNNTASSTATAVADGDLNRDGRVDVEDIGILIREINDGDGEDAADAGGGSTAGDALFDVNRDGSINRADLQALARLILRKEE